MTMPAVPQGPAATVGITTRNRCEDLRRALRSAVIQRGDIEVVVIDDGSTDGTAAMVADEFPGVRLVRHDTSAGYIARRNELADLASAPLLVSLDDDAELTSPDVVAETLRAFADPRVGAVAIPYIERGRGETQVRQRAPVEGQIFVTGPYIGTAHALRLDVFRALGRYRASLMRNTEELDYWTRMLDAGYVTCLGWGAPINHYESPRRVVADIVYFDCRNNILHAWRNVPWPYAAGRAVKVVLYAAGVVSRSTGQHAAVARGLRDGVRGALAAPRERRPVRRSTYRVGRRIRYHGPVPLDALGTARR
jgi:glycosyltransferase involved in cell wall biosynthesis